MAIMNKDFRKTLLTAALGGAIALGAAKLIDRTPAVIRFATGESGVSARLASLTDASVDFSATAEAVTPGVVHIRATSQGGHSNAAPNDPFGDFFGRGGRNFPQRSSGSGVIIADNGHIVTNNHVVAGADELEVTLADKRVFKATVVGTDPTTDLAVIKIDAKDLHALTIGNSDEVRVGEWVLAVGNPVNLESTVTAGIVSAKGRNINILRENASIESFIQTDAAINPGNSGGALVNTAGELIGINTAIASTTGSYAGYAFAIPSNMVAKIVEDIIRFGKAQRAFLGITIRTFDSEMAERMGYDFYQGVYVDSLVRGGSAAEAGIKRSDVIVKIDDREVGSVPELQETIGRHRPGDVVKVVVVRDGAEKAIEVTLKTLTGSTAVIPADENTSGSADASRDPLDLKSLGADFEDISHQLAKKLDIDGGVRVKKLYVGKLQSQTDLREGFIITRANRKPIKNMQDLRNALVEGDGALIEGVYEDEKGRFFYGFGL